MLVEELLSEMDAEFLNSDMTKMREKWNHYTYKKIPVPRVTEIITCASLSNDSLVKWANGLGFKHQNSSQVRDLAAHRGSLVHDAIENFIKTGKLPDISKLDFETQEIMTNCLDGFMSFWENYRFKNEIKSIKMEETVVTPFYGGTYDLLITLNDGRNFLYDFKTTNFLKESQYVQLAAYQYALTEYYHTVLSGVGVLLINKTKPLCQEYFLDFDDPTNFRFMLQCANTFFSVLYTYYNLKQTNIMFNDYLMNVRKQKIDEYNQ